MSNDNRIEIDEAEEGFFRVKLFEPVDDKEALDVTKQLDFKSLSKTKSWLDINWKDLGLDQFWNRLQFNRYVLDEGKKFKFSFRMELVQPEDKKIFDLEDPNNQPRLVAFEYNEEIKGYSIWLYGMSGGFREFERSDVKGVWVKLFSDGLTKDDMYELFEF